MKKSKSEAVSRAHRILMEDIWTDVLRGTGHAAEQPDRRDGSVYRLTPELKTAIKVAVVTFRPLLLRGDPGTGKSSLAAYIARNLGWRYYEHVVTARTEARDLLYTFDAVRRLADAQASRGKAVTPSGGKDSMEPGRYVEPGPLWWALHRASAKGRGLDPLPAGLTEPREPNEEINCHRSHEQAVLLIDEIDKADPDFPNSLLVALGSNVFQIPETGRSIAAAPGPAAGRGEARLSPLLVVITTNEERDLPRAFVRRCITHTINLPDAEDPFVSYMAGVADLHRRRDGVKGSKAESDRARLVAKRLFEVRGRAKELGERLAGTAEYLDAVRACRELNVEPGANPPDPAWEQVEKLTLRKPT